LEDYLLKTCTWCHLSKESKDFPKRTSSKDGRDAWCRACVRTRNAAYYEKNQAAILEQKKTYWDANKEALKPKNRARWAENHVRYGEVSRRWREANRDALLAYFQQRGEAHRVLTDSLKDCPCLDCGRTFPPYVMEFDHVRGTKRFALGKMANHSQTAIEAELAKCELVCCVCHRIRSDERRDETHNQRLLDFHAWLEPLKDAPCSDCGHKFPSVAMDFDHVRGSKVQSISSMGSWGRDKVLAEIDKCELVCANCHRVRTHSQDANEEMVA
jgi:hypothetical protein